MEAPRRCDDRKKPKKALRANATVEGQRRFTRRLRWTTDAARPDESSSPRSSTLETSPRFAGAGRDAPLRVLARRRRAWGAVAAAAQARWFADADRSRFVPPADEDRAADSAAIDAPSSGADVFPLGRVRTRCARRRRRRRAPGGPRARDGAAGGGGAGAGRGIEGAIRAGSCRRRARLPTRRPELTRRSAPAARRRRSKQWRQSPMSWDPSKEDDALFSNPSTRDDSCLPKCEIPPRLLPRRGPTVSTVARRLADAAVDALESAVGAASTELDASAKRGTPPNRAALVRALARARGAADAADAPVLTPAARGRGAGRPRTLRPFVYFHLVSERRDEQLWASSGPSRSPTRAARGVRVP